MTTGGSGVEVCRLQAARIKITSMGVMRWIKVFMFFPPPARSCACEQREPGISMNAAEAIFPPDAFIIQRWKAGYK
jgi:hypothetical protein